MESVTPVIAYPILSKNGSEDATAKFTKAANKLQSIINQEDEAIEPNEPDEQMIELFEGIMGEDMTDIDDLIRM